MKFNSDDHYGAKYIKSITSAKLSSELNSQLTNLGNCN